MLGGVGHDDALRSCGPRDRHRDVGREPAVGEEAAVAQLGCEEERHGDAGAHRLGQVARLTGPRRPVGQIGGDGAERDGQRVEIPAREQVAAQHGGVHQRVGLGFDDRGALQGEAALALLPQDQRLQHAEDRGATRLVGAEERRERYTRASESSSRPE